MATVVCPKCGNSNALGSYYCTKCRERLPSLAKKSEYTSSPVNNNLTNGKSNTMYSSSIPINTSQNNKNNYSSQFDYLGISDNLKKHADIVQILFKIVGIVILVVHALSIPANLFILDLFDVNNDLFRFFIAVTSCCLGILGYKFFDIIGKYLYTSIMSKAANTYHLGEIAKNLSK